MSERPPGSPGSATASAPPLWTLNFILVFLSSLSSYTAFYCLIVCLPVYIKEYGGSTGMAGLALGVLTAAAVIIRPFTGVALDRYGRRAIFLGGLVMFLLPTVAYMGMISVALLLIFRFIQGFGWGICSTAAGTVAADVVPKSRLGEGLGFFSLTASLSVALAPAMGLWLLEAFSFRVMFAACSLLSLLSIGLASIIKYPRLEKRSREIKPAFMEMAALRPTGVALLIAMTDSSIQSFLVLYARQRGLNSAWLCFTALAVATLVSRPLSGLVVDRMGKKGYDLVIWLGVPITVAAVLVLSRITDTWHLVFGGALFGIGYGLIQASMLALCVSLVPTDRCGAANATYWTAFDIGIGVGSIFWGIVAAHFGYLMMFTLTAIPAALCLVVHFFRPVRSA